jgi:hypothetical protein
VSHYKPSGFKGLGHSNKSFKLNNEGVILYLLREIKRHLGNREVSNGNTATKIINAVGKQCQYDGI